MSIWTNPSLQRYIELAEVLFSTEYPCIIDRLSLDTVVGTAEYTLPEHVLSIRRVTWLGLKVDPMPQRTLRNLMLPGTEVGRPREYIYNNIGKQKIQFWPVPQQAIASITTNLFGTEIPNRVIIEFWRVSNNTNFVIPAYFRRQLIKSYVLFRAFQKEGKGQNLKAAKYHKDKWEALKIRYNQIIFDLANKPRKLTISDVEEFGYRMPWARLPIDKFGIAVDDYDFYT